MEQCCHLVTKRRIACAKHFLNKPIQMYSYFVYIILHFSKLEQSLV